MSGADVSNQAHYAHGIEPIDYMRSRFTPEEFRGFLAGNVLKYVSRFQHKDGLKDLEKALVYLQWLIGQQRENEGLEAEDPRFDPPTRTGWCDLQERVTEWARKTFPNATLDSQLEHIREEIAEVEAAPYDRVEWADVLLILMHAALEQGHSMDDLFRACHHKFVACQCRRWGEPDGRGVVHHAGESEGSPDAEEQAHVGRWKSGDHVEFQSDQQVEKGPCTGKIEWVLNGLACISVSDDFVHCDEHEINLVRLSQDVRTGKPLWIFE